MCHGRNTEDDFILVFAINHLRCHCHMQDTSLGMVPINCSVLCGDTGVVDCLQEKQKAADSSARLLHQPFSSKWQGLTLVHHYSTIGLNGAVRKLTLSELRWFILGINALNYIRKCVSFAMENILFAAGSRPRFYFGYEVVTQYWKSVILKRIFQVRYKLSSTDNVNYYKKSFCHPSHYLHQKERKN